jgi:hypothetical protein
MNLSRWLAVAVLAWALAACGHPRGAGEPARADLAAGAMVSLPGGRFWLANRTGPLEEPFQVSSAARSAGLPERRDPRLGFRCASHP